MMTIFIYNDMEFLLAPVGKAWDIGRAQAGGGSALVGAGLFAGATETEAEIRALALVKAIYPVGVKTVGPDVAHPTMIGDLRIVGPDVTHPNFIQWNKDSSSFPRQA